MNSDNLFFKRYLKLLDVKESEPGLGHLKEIVRAQLNKIPFENISKIYFLKKERQCTIPDIKQYLAAIDDFHFGGTCYSINYHLNRLLEFLGYNVILCGADMDMPDVHVLNIVFLDGKEYIVDAGYAAPFRMPIPCYLDDVYTIKSGVDEYRFSPQDGHGRNKVEMYRKGVLHHGYTVNPIPRNISEFNGVIFNSFRFDATFMNSILLTRFTGNSYKIVRNREYISITDGHTSVKKLRTTDEIISTIHEVFGIPLEILKYTLEGMSIP